LAIFCVSITGLVSADSHVEFPSDTVSYTNAFLTNFDGQNSIVCDQMEGGCPGNPESSSAGSAYLSLEGCDGRASLDSTGGDWASPIGDDKTLFGGSMNIPQATSCSIGEYDIQLINAFNDNVIDTGGSVTVEPKNMDAHVGKNIFVNYNIGGNQLRAFQLTNDEITSTPVGGGSYGTYDPSGNIIIHQYRQFLASERGTVTANVGNIATSSDSLETLVSESGLGSCTVNICDTLQKPFTSGNSYQIGTSTTKSGKLNSISPIHESYSSGVNYRPEGEIAFANYPKYHIPQGGSSPEASNSEDGPYFFVCRDGAEMLSRDDGSKEYTNQVIDVSSGSDSQDLRKCQKQSGDWVWSSVNECNDGIDNDGDGDIDDPSIGGNDNDCDGTTGDTDEDPSIGPDPNCKIGAVKSEVDFGGAIFHGAVAQHPTSTGCNTDTTISYTNEDYLSAWKSNIGASTFPKEITCTPPYVQTGCSQVSLGDYDGSTVPVAETVPERQYIEQMLRLQPERPGAENHKTTNIVRDWTEDFSSNSPEHWKGRYKVDATIDEANEEVDINIESTLRSEATTEPTLTKGNVRFKVYIGSPSGTELTTVQGGNYVDWDAGSQNINVPTVTADYKDVRTEGITVRPNKIVLYDGTNLPPTTTDIVNNTERSLSVTNYREAAPMDYVNSNGWTTDYQSLWEAEEKYKAGTDPHSYSGWESKNISEASVYNNDDLSDNDQAWDIANAGASNDLVDSKSIRREGETPIFDGGFAAKCEEGAVWEYDEDNNEWLCDNDLNWEQTVQLPNTFDDSVIGIMFPPTNFMTRSQLRSSAEWGILLPESYPMAVQGKESNFGANIDTAEATCWQGDLGNKEFAAPNEKITGTVSVSDTEVTGIYGEVDHAGTYSCEWNFTTTSGYKFDEASEEDIVEMHKYSPINIASDQASRSGEITGQVWDQYNELGWAYTSKNEFENEVGGRLNNIPVN
jgi:hypothetical protein